MYAVDTIINVSEKAHNLFGYFLYIFCNMEHNIHQKIIETTILKNCQHHTGKHKLFLNASKAHKGIETSMDPTM